MNVQGFSEKVNNIFKKGKKTCTKPTYIMMTQLPCRNCMDRYPKQPNTCAAPAGPEPSLSIPHSCRSQALEDPHSALSQHLLPFLFRGLWDRALRALQTLPGCSVHPSHGRTQQKATISSLSQTSDKTNNV